MKISIVATGKARLEAESGLISHYKSRFDKFARQIGFESLSTIELKANVNDARSQERLILNAIPQGALTVALDPRGQQMTSDSFAHRLEKWRDSGRRELAFIIGGADGLTDRIIRQADFVLSFGAMIWPHILAQIMLYEQLFRAVTIIKNHPYQKH